MAHKNYAYQSNINQAMLGQFGITILTVGETSPVGETYVGIKALSNSILSSDLVALDEEIGDTSITALALDKGLVIEGRFENITATSGILYCYKG
jgi:uncharacterized membrane protein (DUF441 family)